MLMTLIESGLAAAADKVTLPHILNLPNHPGKSLLVPFEPNPAGGIECSRGESIEIFSRSVRLLIVHLLGYTFVVSIYLFAD